MISGAHVIIYSTDADADRAFLRDILQLGSVDVGGGWLIFGLPPSEVAVHPSDENGRHELYLMCDDVEAFIGKLAGHGISCSAVEDQGWGLLTSVALPGGSKLGVYQPHHARPEPPPAAAGRKEVAKKRGRSSAGKRPGKPGKKAARRSSAPAKKQAKRKAAAGRKARAR